MVKRKCQGRTSAAKRQKMGESQTEGEIHDLETRKATSSKLSLEASVLYTKDSQNWDLTSWVSFFYN